MLQPYIKVKQGLFDQHFVVLGGCGAEPLEHCVNAATSYSLTKYNLNFKFLTGSCSYASSENSESIE